MFLFLNHPNPSFIPLGMWFQQHLAAGSPMAHILLPLQGNHHRSTPDLGPTSLISYLSLREMQRGGQIDPFRAHHVLLLEELLLQPLQLLRLEDRPDPLHLAGPPGPPGHRRAQRVGPYAVRQLQTCKKEAAVEGVSACLRTFLQPQRRAKPSLLHLELKSKCSIKGAGRK